jgi:hypothetical protein
MLHPIPRTLPPPLYQRCDSPGVARTGGDRPIKHQMPPLLRPIPRLLHLPQRLQLPGLSATDGAKLLQQAPNSNRHSHRHNHRDHCGLHQPVHERLLGQQLKAVVWNNRPAGDRRSLAAGSDLSLLSDLPPPQADHPLARLGNDRAAEHGLQQLGLE